MATWVVRSKTRPCSQGYGPRHCAIPKQRSHTLVSLGLVAEALFPELLLPDASRETDAWLVLFTRHSDWLTATTSYSQRWATEGSYRDVQGAWDGQHGWDLEPVLARLTEAVEVPEWLSCALLAVVPWLGWLLEGGIPGFGL